MLLLLVRVCICYAFRVRKGLRSPASFHLYKRGTQGLKRKWERRLRMGAAWTQDLFLSRAYFWCTLPEGRCKAVPESDLPCILPARARWPRWPGPLLYVPYTCKIFLLNKLIFGINIFLRVMRWIQWNTIFSKRMTAPQLPIRLYVEMSTIFAPLIFSVFFLCG